MEVFALIGESGSGKSFQSLAVAHQLGISVIIDDGLLIHHGRKVAGFSSKYEHTTIAAIKRAIFLDPDHRREVMNSLQQLSSIENILILATSHRMAQKIAQQLELPDVSRYFLIHDIAQPSEILQAKFIRKTEGKHAIPIPQIQVEKDRWGRLIAHVESIFSSKKEWLGERTIVHPPFQKGRIIIYEHVLKKLVLFRLNQLPSLVNVSKLEINVEPPATAHLACTLDLKWGDSIPAVNSEIQRLIREEVQHHLNIELLHIHVHVEQLVLH